MTATPSTFRCPVISYVDIAWTCVATSDPNILHLDRDFAVQSRGYKDVLVPGTMLIGWIGEYLENWAGSPERLKQWQIRFTAPLWPKEQVELAGRETERRADGDRTFIRCEVVATKTSGEIVARANAELEIASRQK